MNGGARVISDRGMLSGSSGWSMTEIQHSRRDFTESITFHSHCTCVRASEAYWPGSSEP